MKRKFYIPFGETPSLSIDYLLGIIYDARSVTLRLTNGISKEEETRWIGHRLNG